jgi:hypothetical protein
MRKITIFGKQNLNAMFRKILFFLLLTTTIVAQQPPQRGRHAAPVLKEISEQSVLQSVYAKASTLKKVNDFWYKIVDKSGKVYGYALNSTDCCKDVKGYANVTPVLIVTDKKKVIQKVAMLSNYESPNFVSRLENAGYFKNWVGKNVREAKVSQLDGYTGATYTAKAVAKNVDFLLDNAVKKMP